MDWSRLLANYLPKAAKGAAVLIASRLSEPVEPEDPTAEFMERRLALLDTYGKNKQAQAVQPEPELEIRPAREQPCPFCTLEEKAGTVKNHLQFVAQECSPSGLGQATGGMIPKAKAQVSDVLTLARSIEVQGGEAAVMARLVGQLGQDLEPKLEWIGSCEEAQQASDLADRMWEAAAKAAQINFSGPLPSR